MTEATAGIAISSMVETDLNAPGQVGILLPGTEARVIEPESGRIWDPPPPARSSSAARSS